ncbi:MAG: hypothetical protein IPH99_09245 [Xanthomonadales bacterium]|jgi:hypothetical protein|nr:hypothetical protein [Xanthomonadales bacterium]
MNYFQQEFLRWLDVNRQSFAVQPLFEAFDGKRLHYRFEHATASIALLISTIGIRVDVFKGEVTPYTPWDNLFCLEACKIIERKHDDYSSPGHTCATHVGATYAPHTHEALIFVEHCFEPLRLWIATELQPAYWLVFGEDSYSTNAYLQLKDDAELTSAEDEEGVHYESRERLWSGRKRRSKTRI